jgi:hypothetical protein
MNTGYRIDGRLKSGREFESGTNPEIPDDGSRGESDRYNEKRRRDRRKEIEEMSAGSNCRRVEKPTPSVKQMTRQITIAFT